MLLAIAWRNLWRNPRRTLTVVSAVCGGVAMMVIVSSMINGMTDRMLEAVTGSFTGHVQLHREGFRAKRSAALAVPDADRVLEAVRATPGVEAAAGRIYGFAHASIVRGADGEIRGGGGVDVAAPVVTLLGVEPAQERAVTDLPRRVVEGRWLERETDVVLGADVARRAGARVGDAFLPTTTDASGAIRGPWAVGDAVPRVVGIVRTGIAELDGRGAIVTRGYLARLTSMEGRVHEVAIRAAGADAARLAPLVRELRLTVAGVRAGSSQPAARVPATRPLAVVAASRPGVAAAPVRLVGVAPASHGAGRPARGRFVERTDDLVLTAAVAAELGVGPGDRVTVAVPVDCGADVEASLCPPSDQSFVVAGVVEPGAGPPGPRFALVAAQVVSDDLAALAPSAIDDLEGDAARNVALLASRAAGPLEAGDEILAWQEFAPDIAVMLVVFDAAPAAMVFVIFLAVAIGIVNSLLMSTFERIKELGMMKALGLRPSRIVAMVLAESAAIAALGIATGLALGLAVVAYWSSAGLDLGVFMGGGGGGTGGFEIAGVSFDPVIWPSVEASDLARIIGPVAFLTVLAGLWPATKAARIQVTDALRHE